MPPAALVVAPLALVMCASSGARTRCDRLARLLERRVEGGDRAAIKE